MGWFYEAFGGLELPDRTNDEKAAAEITKTRGRNESKKGEGQNLGPRQKGRAENQNRHHQDRPHNAQMLTNTSAENEQRDSENCILEQ